MDQSKPEIKYGSNWVVDMEIADDKPNKQLKIEDENFKEKQPQ